MCFSAEASFTASGALAISSIAIARIPKEKSDIPLALFPAIFAAHQFIEGLLWLNHSGTISDTYKTASVYGFVFIAFVLWPLYVPFSAYLIEKSKFRKLIVLACLFIGLYSSITLLISIIANSIDVSVVDHSFSYKMKIPEKFMIPYFISVSIPFLVSSSRNLMFFGIALTVSCAIAAIIATSATFPSIWCFYAAILSLALYLYFKLSAKNLVLTSKMSEQQVST